MIKAKQVSINKNKNRYHTININDLDPFLLDIKKKSSKDIDIYYINYIQENFNDNPLRIKIDFATGYFKEKNDEKYLILDSTKKYERVWSGIRSEIERINGGKKVFYETNYCNIGVNTEDDLPMKQSLKFLTLLININLVLQANNKLYPQLYLDVCFMSYKFSIKKSENEKKNEQKKIFFGSI